MRGKVKLIVLADIHENRQVPLWVKTIYGDADGLLLLGDVTTFRREASFNAIMETLTATHRPLYLLPGNHDPESCTLGVQAIHGVQLQIEGVTLAGIGGASTSHLIAPFELTDQQAEALLKTFQPGLTVLTSHTPPYNTRCDLAANGTHIGSRPVRSFIETKNPKLVVTGHVHEAAGLDSIGNTTIANVGPASNGNYSILQLGAKPQITLGRINA